MTGPVADADAEQAIVAVGAALARLRGLWDDIVAGVHGFLATLPAIGDAISDAFGRLAAQFNAAMEKLQRIFTERGSASAVRQVGTDWNTLVGAPMSDQAGLLQPGQLDSTGQWIGNAATKYLRVTQNQTKAFAQLKEITDGVQDVLNGIAGSLRSYWVAMAVATGSYVAAMAGCAVAASTAAGLLPALISAAAASVTFLGAVSAYSVDFANMLDDNRARLRQLENLDGSFAAGSWPPATAPALADASVLDDDGTSAWTVTP